MEILAKFSDCFAASTLVCSLIAMRADGGLAPSGALDFSMTRWSAITFGRGSWLLPQGGGCVFGRGASCFLASILGRGLLCAKLP
jgi:hypothetical protein